MYVEAPVEYFRTRVRLPPPPPDDNPIQSKEVQEPVRNSGFFLAICPKTCYKVYQNPVILGIRRGVAYTQNKVRIPKKEVDHAKAYHAIDGHEGFKSEASG